jgi:hypothetical protein
MTRHLMLLAVAALFTLSGCGSSSSDKCLGSSTKCDGTCVSLDTDQQNCGACGNACDPGLACSAGHCVATCAEGFASCDGSTCANLQLDWNNCGACGNACAADQVCAAGTCGTWITLAAPNNYGLPDFTPKGATALYSPSSSNMEAYSIADDSWTEVATSLVLPGGYAYPAWFGGNLYFLDGGNLYTYSIADMTSTSEAIDGMPSSSSSQATADDAGNVYAMAGDGSIIQYNPATAALYVFDGPADLPSGDEPRIAWDSKTAKLYIADYSSTPFYSLDPADGTLTPLAAFPNSNGVNDGFCSDRRGRIYTSDSDGTDGLAMMFDTETGTWSQLPSMPNAVGSSGDCTVSGDGYLYFGGDDGYMFALKVF